MIIEESGHAGASVCGFSNVSQPTEAQEDHAEPLEAEANQTIDQSSDEEEDNTTPVGPFHFTREKRLIEVSGAFSSPAKKTGREKLQRRRKVT